MRAFLIALRGYAVRQQDCGVNLNKIANSLLINAFEQDYDR